MQTRLIRITEVDKTDWGYDEALYAKLQAAFELHAPVTVVGRAMRHGGDPTNDYYNVRLADGTELPVVHGYHLEGIENFETPPATLTCQYLVELKVAKHLEGAYLDHDMMALAITNALTNMLAISGFAGYTTTVDDNSVHFETAFYAGD